MTPRTARGPRSRTRHARVAAGAVLAGVLLAPGCILDDGPGGDVDTLASAMARWESAAPAAYRIREHWGCFCACPREFTATVRDGDVTGVTDVEGFEGQTPEAAAAAALGCARTVEQLFAILRENVDHADRYEAVFDPAWGFPTRISIDPSREAVDEEIFVETSGFAPLAAAP